jgi:trk system potassium uptake protein TrkH
MGLALLVCVGTLALLLPPMSYRSVTPGEALFTATSAVTVTGLSLSPLATTYTLAGQIVVMLLVQVGGAGFMVALVMALRILGRQVSLQDRLALTSQLGVDSPRSIVGLMQKVSALMLVVEAAGAVLLFVRWTSLGGDATGLTFFYALFVAVMSFCNAGFSVLAGFAPFPSTLTGDPFTLLVMGGLILLGGLGIPVYLETVSWRRRHRWTLHSRLTIATAAVLVLGGMLVLLVAESRSGVLADMPVPERMLRAWFQSVSARTAGFPGIGAFEDLSQASRLALVALMFIGTAPASMGGGITTGTLIVLVLATASYASGHSSVRVAGRVISQGSLWRASVILVTGLGAVLSATWLLLVTHDVRLDEALFEVISAFSTTGLSLGVTPELNSFGRAVIIAMMFWGRLGAATLMIAMLERPPAERLVDYPEEHLLVG